MVAGGLVEAVLVSFVVVASYVLMEVVVVGSSSCRGSTGICCGSWCC